MGFCEWPRCVSSAAVHPHLEVQASSTANPSSKSNLGYPASISIGPAKACKLKPNFLSNCCRSTSKLPRCQACVRPTIPSPNPNPSPFVDPRRAHPPFQLQIQVESSLAPRQSKSGSRPESSPDPCRAHSPTQLQIRVESNTTLRQSKSSPHCSSNSEAPVQRASPSSFPIQALIQASPAMQSPSPREAPIQSRLKPPSNQPVRPTMRSPNSSPSPAAVHVARFHRNQRPSPFLPKLVPVDHFPYATN